MLTVNKRGKFQCREDLWKAWRAFNILQKESFGKRWRYVAVPELHADGVTYHMHAAIRGYFNVHIVRRNWYVALGGNGDEKGADTPGAVHIRPPEFRGSGAYVRRIASYISKYVGKGFGSGDSGRRLFACSAGLTPHRVERWAIRYWDGIKEVAQSLVAGLHQLGGTGLASVYFWSRHHSDESLLSMGFIINSDWKELRQC